MRLSLHQAGFCPSIKLASVPPSSWRLSLHQAGFCPSIKLASVPPSSWRLSLHQAGVCPSIKLPSVPPSSWRLSLHHAGVCSSVHMPSVCLVVLFVRSSANVWIISHDVTNTGHCLRNSCNGVYDILFY